MGEDTEHTTGSQCPTSPTNEDLERQRELASELGKRGGESTKRKYGQEHYKKMGKASAEKHPRPKEYYSEIGKLGAAASQRNHKENGKKGGEKLLKERGVEYYREIGRRGRQKQLNEKKEES